MFLDACNLCGQCPGPYIESSAPCCTAIRDTNLVMRAGGRQAGGPAGGGVRAVRAVRAAQRSAPPAQPR